MLKQLLFILITLLALPALAAAQDPASARTTAPVAPSAVKAPAPAVDYSKPRSHIPDLFLPYVPRTVAAPNLSNAPRLLALVRDGKLQLSLADAVALALENNLDLVIARYNLGIADTDILRAKAGSSVRGVSTGVVQNTPGGNASTSGSGSGGSSGSGSTSGSSGSAGSNSGGSGVGGTSTASGGAGSGSSGLVQSTLGTGSNIESFDPVFTSNIGINDNHTPSLNEVIPIPLPILAIDPTRPPGFTLAQHNSFVNMGYQQAWATGTSLNFSVQNNKLSTNAVRAAFNPQYNVNWTANFRQHILQGFGFAPNLRFIRIARNNREIADVSFRNQVISTVSQIQNIYWDLVNAAENVRVQQESVGLAGRTLSDNQSQVDVGSMAPIELVRAKSELAARNQDLIIAESNYELQQLFMLNAISKDMDQSLLTGVQVVPVDAMAQPVPARPEPLLDLVNEALSARPELVQSRVDLKNREITKRSARNALLPSVDLVGSYSGAGIAGAQNTLCQPGSGLGCGSGSGGGGGGGVGSTDVKAPYIGDYGDAFGNAFDKSYPSYSVGLSVNIPIRNRAAQADQVRSELEMRQAQVRLQQLENQVKIEVRNAQFQLQQARARVEAAQSGVELGRQTLDAENDKLSVGASTPYLVLQSQRDLVQAESNLVAAMTAYQKARIEFERVTGRTLKNNGIALADAETGRVTTVPAMQGTQPQEQK